MPASIHTIETIEELDSLKEEWFQFADQIQDLPPFCRPNTWVPALASLLATNQRGETLVSRNRRIKGIIVEIREDGVLQAVFALYQKGRSLCSFSENDIDYQDIQALSIDAACDALNAAISYSVESKLIFLLGLISEQSMLASALGRNPEQAGVSIFRRYFGVCIVSDFEIPDKQGENFKLVVPRRYKKSYRSASKRITSEFPDHHFELKWGSEITRSDIESVAVLHIENQEERPGPSVFNSSTYVDFLTRQALAHPDFLMARLLCRDEVIAFGLGYADGPTFHYYITGFNRKFASFGPGIWIMINTCSALIDKFDTDRFRVDFLTGNESYKSHWETGRYYVDRVVIIPKNLRRWPWAIAYRLLYQIKEAKNRLFKIGPWAQ
tara:strand:- start:1011 stop:2156 length:1146 start_codon:yes stop_codon:yes gene_type:complete